MNWIKAIWNFFVPLLSEKNDKGEYKRASLGRVAFWIVLILALYVWITTTGDIQPAHLQMLYITATYNLMKKAIWLGSDALTSGKKTEEIERKDPYDEPAPRI